MTARPRPGGLTGFNVGQHSMAYFSVLEVKKLVVFSQCKISLMAQSES